LIMIPLLFRLFFVRLKLSTPSLPENFTEQVDDHNQVEEDDSQNQKTTAS